MLWVGLENALTGLMGLLLENFGKLDGYISDDPTMSLTLLNRQQSALLCL